MSTKLQIKVFNYKNELLKNAKVLLYANAQGRQIYLNTYSGYYETTEFPLGDCQIEVSAEGYKKDSRKTTLDKAYHSEVFVLGTPNMPYYYRGKVKVPFAPLNDLIGVGTHGSSATLLRTLAQEQGLTPVKVGKTITSNNAYVYRFPASTSEKDKRYIQEIIQGKDYVLIAAPVLQLSERSMTLLSDMFIVKFKPELKRNEINEYLNQFGLEQLRTIPYDKNTFHVKSSDPLSYDLLRICEELVATGAVEYAEPDLYHAAEDDGIDPLDWLFPLQWDHKIIDTPNAWQSLRKIISPFDLTFGNPGIIIAVVDKGINVALSEFSGMLSDGSTKIYESFDFGLMQAGNINLNNETHGIACASAATASANNPSSIPGFSEGMAGIAGNCKLMSIKRPTTVGLESRYADMYIWIGGFNPNSLIQNFPAPISPGADIITNSFGYSADLPISGLMQATFNHLTTHGRNGKGILLFFSVGNYSSKQPFALKRPWAAYEKTIAIGASSLNDKEEEVTTPYSGFGMELDLCAPSHDAYIRNRILHNPPINYGVLTATNENAGNIPGAPTLETTLTVAANRNATKIIVANTTGFKRGQAIFIDNTNTPQAEANIIRSISGNTINLNSILLKPHSIGTKIFAASANYLNNFGGTSYATPVCAGVAALILSVDNNLTWLQVRDILRNTAVKIDPDNKDAMGKWVDGFSQFYGYGRVNAALAVAKASEL